MKSLLITLIVALAGTKMFASDIAWSNHFFDRVNTIKLQSSSNTQTNNLYIGAAEGFFALDSNGDFLFQNTDLLNVETINFIDYNNDGIDEILISNWLEFALLDASGETIAKRIISTFSTYALAIDFYLDSNNNLKVITANQGADSQNSEQIAQHTYNQQSEFYSQDWSFYIDFGKQVPSEGLQVFNDKLYVISSSSSGSDLAIHSLNDGTRLHRYSFTDEYSSLDVLAVMPSHNLLITGDSNNYKDNKNLYTFDANDLTLKETITLDLPIKQIKSFDDFVLVVTNNRSSIYYDPTANKTYLYKYEDGALVKQFEYDSQDNEVYNAKLYYENDNLVILFGIGAQAIKLNANAELLSSHDLSYDQQYSSHPVRAVEYGNYNGSDRDIVGSINIYMSSDEQNLTTLYSSGFLVQKIFAFDINANGDEEIIVIDGYRTYIYSSQGNLLWMLPTRAIDVKAADFSGNGVNDLFVLNDEGIFIIDSQGNTLFEYEKSDIRRFDIQDINANGFLEIAYITYHGLGNKIEVIDTDKNIIYEKTTSAIPNINYFEIIPSNQESGYSILVNLGDTLRFDFSDSSYSASIERSNFIDNYFHTILFDDYNENGTLDLLRVYYDYESQHYGLRFLDINAPTQTILHSFEVGENQIRGIALFDANLDGINDILVTDEDSLYLFTKEGSLIWQYTQEEFSSKDRFTNIAVSYQSNLNHKIYVSGRELHTFDKNGNLLKSQNPSGRYMASSSGTYSNPIKVLLNADLLLGQMGVHKFNYSNTNAFAQRKLHLQAGWNLVALPIDKTIQSSELVSLFNKAEHIWSYDAGSWRYSSTKSQNTDALAQTPYQIIDAINPVQGFWVYNNSAQTINLVGKQYNLKQYNRFLNPTHSWSLLGTSQSITTQSLFDSKSNIQTLWVYDNGWRADSLDEQTILSLQNLEIKKIDAIKEGQGFWMVVQ